MVVDRLDAVDLLQQGSCGWGELLGRSGDRGKECEEQCAEEHGRTLYRLRQPWVTKANCASVSGTTERRPWRTSGESLKSLLALMVASVTAATGLPALISTRGFFASLASTPTTVAVPATDFSSPV